jgi:hypothetical protein
MIVVMYISMSTYGIQSLFANAPRGEKASREGGQMFGERGDPREKTMGSLTKHIMRGCNQGTWRMSE